jgi:serine/threonine-protein kinase RsbT
MTSRREVREIRGSEDVVRARQAARTLAVEAGFGLVDQTRIVTAVSELARNTLVHGGGGVATLEIVNDKERLGIRAVFRDQGPGIPDVDQAIRDGYSTGDGLGLGLGGSRRLMDDFEISSTPGQGTTVGVTRWR